MRWFYRRPGRLASAAPERAGEIGSPPLRRERRKELPMKALALVALSLALQAAFILQVVAA